MGRLISVIVLLGLAATSVAQDSPFEVTEKRGNLYIVTREGAKTSPVEDIPNVDYRGQGGLATAPHGD